MKRSLTFVVALALTSALALPSSASASRILELTDVAGVRENQLIGYGLVVGLANTGDTGASRFTLQSVAAMLRRLGATIEPSMIQTRNAAAVMVTATLPPEGNPGTPIDVTVSSMGNARSLMGGTLLQTPLLGADGNVYAVAQGAVMVGGFGATGASGTSTVVNHLTAGRVPSGGIIERRAPGSGFSTEGPILLTLRDPSFVTARRIATAIEASIGAGSAEAVDASSVAITVPEQFAGDRVGLLAQVQLLEVEPEASARVVIDERTGTVVIGSAVRLREAAVAHGGLTVEIEESTAVSQPMPFGGGTTVAAPESQVGMEEQMGDLHYVAQSADLHDVVMVMNALGASPRDLITIFQALHTAGALDAEIETQ
ncbi:MAG: flagellar basal body P-ring protein FlgI [Sandaracinaceae bacterium]|nr:flagellar basal body P-ring protein FlgI [Sandaracinaceae bacterium]